MASVVMERIAKVRCKMLIKYPFYSVLLMGMDLVVDHTYPRAATNMKTLWLNPDFVETISDNVLMFVVAHEIDHVCKQHILRLHGRDLLTWNMATDYCDNLFLKDCGFEVWSDALIDEKYRDPDTKFAMSADNIYRLLEEEREQDKQQQQAGGQGSSGDQDDPQDQQGGGQGAGDGQDQDDAGGGQGPPPPPGWGEPGGKHYSPMLGDLQEPEEAEDQIAKDKLERDIRNRVAQAATVAKMMGNLPAAMERFVNEILAPQVPWYDKLRYLMNDFAPIDEDWSQRNRRFREIYLPTDHSEHMGGVGIINDTSGSIGNDELVKFNSEGNSVIEDLKPEWVRIMWADMVVAGEQLFEPGDVFKPEPVGGGGTDMRVPLKAMEKHEPEVVLLFTDGVTPWPKTEPPYPLIVCCTTNAKVPFGEVIRI